MKSSLHPLRTACAPHPAAVWRVAAVLLAVSAATASLASQEHAPPSVAEIDAWVEAGMERWDVPGLALAVVVDGEVFLTRGYGVRELGQPAAVNEETLFSIGSCSKAFGAATLATLVEDGALTWDDRIVDHLPWFRLHDPWTTQEIRVHDIVTHRVGTGSNQQLRPLAQNRRDYLSRLPYSVPVHTFRDQYGYTNDMLILTGELVETVSGTTWDAFAKERLWTPLGMNSTTARMSTANANRNHAMPHAFIERRYVGSFNTAGPALEPVAWQYPVDVTVPSGGVVSTAADMARWMKFHLGTHTAAPLSWASVERMHTPHTVIQNPSSWMTFDGPGAYAMGWATGHFGTVRTVGHAGNALGFNCSIALVPEHGFGVFTNGNRNSELPFVLTKWMVARFFGDKEMREHDWHGDRERSVAASNAEAIEAEQARLDARLPQGASIPLDAYVGTYKNGYAGELRVRIADGPADPLRPAEGRGARWDATPGVHERAEASTANTSVAEPSAPYLIAELDGRERPIRLPLEPWHLDQFDAWYGDIRIRFSFDLSDMAEVTGVTLDYYGAFDRVP